MPSLPPEEDPNNWSPFQAEEISGEYFSGREDVVIRFQFATSVHDLYATRPLDMIGNGLDLYTRDGLVIRHDGQGRYELRIPRYFRIDHQLFFFLHWKRQQSIWSEQQGFVVENNELYYLRFD